MKFKCTLCHLILKAEDLEDGNCPNCHSKDNLQKMCEKDHNNCSHDIVDGLAYCPVCGAPMCPICGSHSVSQVSRVTGYLADVAGWNSGKRQELVDRHRVNIPEENP